MENFCLNCRETFDEPNVKNTTFEEIYGCSHLFSDSTPTKVYSCPFCGSENFEELEEEEINAYAFYDTVDSKNSTIESVKKEAEGYDYSYEEFDDKEGLHVVDVYKDDDDIARIKFNKDGSFNSAIKF